MSALRILLTNDDGIHSKGLAVAETIARIRRVNGPESIGRCAADCPCFFGGDAG